jgi:dUTP pyrophosphatase
MALELKVKYLVKDVPKLAYAKSGDAAFDLFAAIGTTVGSMERVQISTGVAVEIPEGYVGLIWDKSGLSQKFGLKTLGGVVDAGYRGEIFVGMINLSKETYVFEKGHKVAQMIIQKREHCDILEVEQLGESERGDGGFGSTGK